MSTEKFYKRLPFYRLLVASIVVITVIACSIQQIRYIHWGGDPRVFVHAAQLMLRGEDIINYVNPYGLYYVYPPLFAFLYIPFTFLPIDVVIIVWTIIQVLLLGWSIAAFYSGMSGGKFLSLDPKSRWVVCFFAVLLSAR